jgi:hypothetical protein
VNKGLEISSLITVNECELDDDDTIYFWDPYGLTCAM